MKQILKSFAVLALAAFAASCAKERIAAPSGEETEVSFTVSAPVIQTRAIADGTTVDKVACCVYDSEGKLIENGISQTVEMSGKKATFTTRLVTGQTYSFLFWAYKSKGGNGDDKDDSAYYTLNKANKTVTVSYTDAFSNDESRDAFYKYIAQKEITGAVNETVELTRPFAQLNFGVETADIAAAKAVGITADKSKVKLTGLANVLNLADGSVTGEAEATFALAACPTTMTNPEELTGETLTVNNKTYGYVAMNYVLVGKDKTLTTAELTIAKTETGTDTEINTLTVNNVPLQGNYRTNVVGNLFTSEVIQNIVVDSKFANEYVKEIWDGQVNEPATDVSGNYLITLPSELAWVAQQTNSGDCTFKGKTVQLQDDIDLCNGNWTPIGGGGHSFEGTFDGQGHTISNLNVYSTKTSDVLGLFGSVNGYSGGIKNFTIDGAKVISEVGQGRSASCGVVVGDINNTITGVTVKNAIVKSNHYVGGICGYGYVNIQDCKVDNATLTASAVYTPEESKNSKMCPYYDGGDKVGGIVGYVGEGTYTISGCAVSNVTITGFRDLGGICGMCNNDVTFSNNTVGDSVVINVDATYNYKDYTEKASFNANSVIGRKAERFTETGSSGTAKINYPADIAD